MDFPKYDGKTPLTKEDMNRLVAKTKANSKLMVTGGMTMLDMGSMGKILVPPDPDVIAENVATDTTTTTTSSKNGTGFWARLYVSGATSDPANAPTSLNPGMTTRPERPYAYAVEQMLGAPGLLNTVDHPSGRRFYIENFHYAFQHVGSLSTLTTPQVSPLIALANYTSGSFTIQIASHLIANGSQIGTATTRAIAWPPSVASIQAALTALPAIPGISSMTVTLVSQGTTPQSGQAYAFNIGYVPSDSLSAMLATVSSVNLRPVTGTTNVTQLNDNRTATASAAQRKLLNISPYGPLIFCQAITDSTGGTHYQFDLPYTGFWGRITNELVPDSDPVVYPFSDTAVIRFNAETESLAHVIGSVTGHAQEINGETSVGVGTLVWITPVFVGGKGFFYFFQAPADVRLLRFLGAGVPNAQVQLRHSFQSPFLAPGNPIAAISEQTATGYAHMVSPSGSQDLFFPGSYYVGSRDGVESGYPKYVAKPELYPEDY